MSSSLFQLNSITRSDSSIRFLIPSGVDLYKYVIFLSDLKPGKCSSVVEARLLRFWEARNVKRGGELMWVDMLLMDVNSTLMQATINANRLPKFQDRLAAGTIYSVSGFDVARCAQNFKLADSSLMIRFSDSTEFDVLSDPVSPIPAEGFRFRNQSELVGLANTNTHLPDIIGEIVLVKSTVSDPPEDKNRVMVTVKLENDVSVTLSLFDAQAVSFHQKLGGMCGDPKVIVATSINPKMVGGRLFLNATSGTHVYYDKETHAGESLFYRLVARDTGLPSAAPLLRSYAKVEPMTIAELNNFITTDPPQQEIDFLCTGRVSRVEADKGWCYVACSKCSKKLQRTVTSFECARCSNPHAVGSLRYRVEMVVTDDTAEGTFVCFDGVMTKLHNLRASEAAQLLAEEGVNPEESAMPPFVAGMEGKTYTFQVRVTSYNFTVNHQTFTVSRIINEVEHAPAPDFVDDGGDDNDDDDASNGTIDREKSGSGKGICESSKSAGKEPAGNMRKRARIA
ncbi:BnaC01g27690D [Brassica napus]|uniref:BnaC01g27690D protein n=2 Tax=Brassica napus TaxID=3708 RepID=A0A078I7G7_BRANA|nr:BnaC01g27690D [Brassica napus]